jgi:SAM-dependent methyltransferase
MNEGPYTAEFFKQELAGSYAAAKRIVPRVLELVPARSVLDVGCGPGHFLRAFLEAGVSDIAGIDGDYVPRDQRVIGPDVFRATDLAAGFNLDRQFDLVLSLEVAEHLPAESADRFVESLIRHGSVVVFSAAIPHQDGTGHVNEQWPSYWAQRFEPRGYRVYDIFRPMFWHDEEIAWWYRQNILLFANAEACARFERLAGLTPSSTATLDRVHPAIYLAHARTLLDTAGQLEQMTNFLSGSKVVEVERLPNGRMNLKRRST